MWGRHIIHSKDPQTNLPSVKIFTAKHPKLNFVYIPVPVYKSFFKCDSNDVKIEDSYQQPEAAGNTTASKEMRETVEWRRVFGQMKAKHQNIFHK